MLFTGMKRILHEMDRIERKKEFLIWGVKPMLTAVVEFIYE